MADSTKDFREMQSAVVRFAGDSGDGMQIVGERFTDVSVLMPNAVATFPDFPSEIRAPAGSLGGVSAYQVHFGSRTVLTPGDEPDALVAMNPAALKVHLADLTPGGLLVVNADAFTAENLEKAGYKTNPLDNPELASSYQLIQLDITNMTVAALKESPIPQRDKLRCKNFFTLGFMCWVYCRPIDPTIEFISSKWSAQNPELAEANIKVLKAGYFLVETLRTTRNRYSVDRASVEPGVYRKVSGNEATALGLTAAAKCAKRDLFFAGYPITPATSILENLAPLKHFGVTTLQVEDEIAAIGVALGGSYAGKLGVTATSGPGMCLKSEFMGLAVTTELPLVIINVQRGGPSTGLPTKTEQSDLNQALHGRHGESPMPVIAANSPSDCFSAAFEAARIALQHSTPVILLTDGYLANGSEPWKVIDETTLPDISVPFASESEPYSSFKRNPDTLARTQAIPGQPGLEHRIGGLEKSETGAISYDPENHRIMTGLRAAKVANIAKSLPPQHINGDPTGKVLVIGWGGTYGAITTAVSQLRERGFTGVSSTHLRYLNPLPADLGAIIAGFEKVLVPELNLGQLCQVLRATLLVDAIPMAKVMGQPYKVSEIRERVLQLLTT